VLASFFHLSKREAQEVAAALDPVAAPPRREVVTALRPASAALALAGPAPGSPDAVSLSVVLPEEPEVRAADHPAELVPALPARPPPPPPSTAEPFTEALSRLHLTVSRDFLRKLEAARDALAHSRPGASSQEALEAGLDLLLQQADRRKGLVEKPHNLLAARLALGDAVVDRFAGKSNRRRRAPH
jgi:hypothetical protein